MLHAKTMRQKSKPMSGPMRRRGYMPLWMLLVLGAIVLVLLGWWTKRSSSDVQADGRETIVFWGSSSLGEDIYTVVNRFEQEYTVVDPKTGKTRPRYKVIFGTAVSRNMTGDAQRLLCAVAGEVPPDVVFFDRFAIGEWAGRGALEDLTPYINEKQQKWMVGERARDSIRGASAVGSMLGACGVLGNLAQVRHPLYLDLSEYYGWSVQEASYATPGTNERPGIYGIPVGVDIRVLFSNGNLLQQNGLVDSDRKPRAAQLGGAARVCQQAHAVQGCRKQEQGDEPAGLRAELWQ